MEKELISVLACPVCQGELKLKVAKENKKEVVSGLLYCCTCDKQYPIIDGIPNLLPSDHVIG
jgi:uncharacterized protein